MYCWPKRRKISGTMQGADYDGQQTPRGSAYMRHRRSNFGPAGRVLREALMDYHRPMASDNRDWYRDWWRKKTGYVERAGFRMSEGDRQRAKHAREWRAILVKLALFVLAVVVLIVVKRTML